MAEKSSAGTTTPERRKAPDWERIEVQFRANTMSVREIAAQHGISHTAINKRAKDFSWERDLQAKIKAKADALVSKAQVSAEVSAETKITEALTVEVESEVQARIRLAHRRDISRSRALCMNLLGELEAQTADVPALRDLGVMLRKEDDKGLDKLNDAYMAIISLPERTKTMKALAESLKTLVGLEREAFGIGAEPVGDKDPLAELLKRITSGNGSTVKPVQADPELDS